MKYNYETHPQGLSQAGDNLNLNYRFLFHLIEDILKNKKRIKVLELGVGGGRNLQIIKQRFKDRVDLNGTDISEVAIKYAKSLKIGKFSLGRSEDIPKGKYDLILMIDILEHLESQQDVKKTLENSIKALESGGYIYTSIPIELNKYSLIWLFSKFPFFKELTLKFFGHTLQFDINKLMKIVKQQNIKIEKAFYSAHYFTQLQTLLFFYIPKILLMNLFSNEVFEKARDSNEILFKKPTLKVLFINIFKKALLLLNRPFAYLAFYESLIRGNSFFGAGNIHLLLSKKKL